MKDSYLVFKDYINLLFEGYTSEERLEIIRFFNQAMGIDVGKHFWERAQDEREGKTSPYWKPPYKFTLQMAKDMANRLASNEEALQKYRDLYKAKERHVLLRDKETGFDYPLIWDSGRYNLKTFLPFGNEGRTNTSKELGDELVIFENETNYSLLEF